jgi:hypothetical protein
MNFRRLVGAGIRYEIVKRERVSLYAGTGIFYEEESWQSSLEEVGTRNTKLLKSNNYLSARYEARENLSFNAIVYYQAGPDRNAGLFRQRGSAEVNVTVQISNNISMKTSFSSTYENHPVIPVKKFIYALTNGIEVNF